jgi:serine/threonine protein kinase
LKENEVHFWKEVNMLKRFNGRSHDHLVTLLMTWRMDDRHYFLFPAAECDLLSYWEDKHPTIDFRDTPAIQWLSAQIRGMTEALAVIHNPTRQLEEQQRFGRHGDLKAENILWYPSNDYERGIFVIADFGLGALNTEKSRSNIPGENIPTTPGYRPPECDLEGGLISRSFDVWTFGCLLLEMICWALGGNQLRAKFENERMTPYITGSNSDIFFDIQYRHNSGRGKQWVVKVKEVVTEVCRSTAVIWDQINMLTVNSGFLSSTTTLLAHNTIMIFSA